jgi:hypothetical protein
VKKKRRKKIFQVPISFGKSCEDSFCPAEENSGHGLKYLMFQEGLCGDKKRDKTHLGIAMSH